MDSVPKPPGTGSGKGSSYSSKSPDSTSKKKSSKSTHKKPSLQEVRKKGRMDRSKGEEEMSNQLRDLDIRSKPRAAGTGLVYSDVFTHYHCLSDSHVECPERVTAIMAELEKQGLLSRCVQVETRAARDRDLQLVHTEKYIELLKSTQNMSERELQALGDTYDSVFLHPESFVCARMAVGAILQLVDKVMTSEIRNGISITRPPGHHAQSEKMNGYCLLNNVAIAARYAQTQYGLERVLIVDWDVHHGQGIQYTFQEDPSVLYFSVHRYEGAGYWPHLPESDSSAVGTGPGQGYNINVPWNETHMKDMDYISAFQQLLLPVAYEFQPQLVLVAAGFDCVAGDPKGEMSVSPECFAVLTHLLLGLAQGRVILGLEGGYNLESTARGVCACVRSLLGDSCPRLGSPGPPCDSALKSISQTISSLYPFWTSLQTLEGGLLGGECDSVTLATSKGHAEGWGESQSQATGLVYDQRMMEHHNMWDSHHPELPQRISRIFSRHEDLGLVSRCCRIEARLATEEEVAMCHSVEHIAKIKSTEAMKPRDLHRLGDEYNSIYISTESYRCALLAAGACFNAAEAVLTGQVRNAVAIVRPPGHHAEREAACGFCFFNTAALTARYAQAWAKKPLRVLILDWDVHHGNGTQHIFEDDDSVLYISLHRYDDGLFFPFSDDADYDKVGKGKGQGYNVNISWSGGKMGNSEYLAAFQTIVMPVARQFDPELVLVSAGFDAAQGDPLGGYKVTPEGYAHLTHLLMSLAGGRVLIILEGGYNLTSISESMAMCTSTLLGDPPPMMLQLPPPHPNAVITINQVLRTHAPYWSSLRIQIPDSLRLALPSPKLKGKRTSGGRGGKSPRQETPGEGMEQDAHSVGPNPAQAKALQDITQGLQALDLERNTSATSSPESVPVGGARRKVRSGIPENCGAEEGLPPAQVTSDKKKDEEAVCSTLLQVQSATKPDKEAALDTSAIGDQEAGGKVEASGWSKLAKDQTVFELFNGACDTEQGTMYVVDPLPWCPHLEAVKPLPKGGIDVFLPCEDCGTDAENWVCLVCYKVSCGRYVNQHMVTHGSVSGHPLVLSFADLSVWCYTCEAYVHNKVLHAAKNAAHLSKFGEAVPCSNAGH